MSSPIPNDDIDEVDVLIVGGGPAGLSAALSLHYHTHLPSEGGNERRRPPRILLVDALPQGQNESRALVIHARTLEALESINCHEPILTQGYRATSLNIQSASSIESKGSKLFTVDFTLLEGRTRYPYALVISQHVTEAVFGKLIEERAGAKEPEGGLRFIRDMELVGMEEMQRSGRNGFLVNFANGRRVWCQYLVGTDGSRSPVRTLAQIPFEDPSSKSSWMTRMIKKLLPIPQLEENLCIADIIFTEDLTRKFPGLHKEVAVTFGKEGFLLFAPVKVTPEMREQAREQRKRRQDTNFDAEEYDARPYWYRLAFVIPPNELALTREVLVASQGAQIARPNENGTIHTNGDGNSNGKPVHRDHYVSSLGAVEYLQKKLDAGMRYIPNPTSGDSEANERDVAICPLEHNIPSIQKVIWASTFRVRYAIAETFHKVYSDSTNGSGSTTSSQEAGHVLLAGDAAHVHSPAGGQGMNLGIRDGVECGRSIAMHWQREHATQSASPPTATTPLLSPSARNGHGQENPLDTYSTSRRAEAIPIIGLTKRLSLMALLPSRGYLARLSKSLMLVLGKLKFVRRKFVLRASGIGNRKPGPAVKRE